jgi:Proteasome-substrate-size regulator, mid region
VSIQIIDFGRISSGKMFFREHKARPVWFFTPPESYRLTEQDITDFVNCIKEYAFISIFNKTYNEEAAKACQYLSILRPELIVPTIVEKSDILSLSFNISLNLIHFIDTFRLLIV